MNNVRVEILEQVARERRSRSPNGGTFRVQRAAVHGLAGARYPREVDIPLGRDQAPYPVGMYALSAESLRVFADMLDFRPILEPAKPVAAATPTPNRAAAS